MSFSIGDVVTPIHTINFLDGSYHQFGKEYTVKPGHLSYYIVNASDYKLVRSVSDTNKNVNKPKLCRGCQGWGCWECCTSEQQIRSMQGTFG